MREASGILLKYRVHSYERHAWWWWWRWWVLNPCCRSLAHRLLSTAIRLIMIRHFHTARWIIQRVGCVGGCVCLCVCVCVCGSLAMSPWVWLCMSFYVWVCRCVCDYIFVSVCNSRFVSDSVFDSICVSSDVWMSPGFLIDCVCVSLSVCMCFLLSIYVSLWVTVFPY